MTKLIATPAALLGLALSAPLAHAADAPSTTRFEATLTIPMEGSVEEAYISVQRQAHRVCKQQIRSVRTFSARLDYLRACKIELTETAIQSAERSDIRRHHAALKREETRRLLAALGSTDAVR